jgi:hypothetical protein
MDCLGLARGEREGRGERLGLDRLGWGLIGTPTTTGSA